MTTTIADSATVRWDEPTGLNPRGTLVVFPGRGESADVYRRFAARIAADAYRVAVLQVGDTDPVTQLKELAADPWAVVPLVVAGSDSGALQALSAATALTDEVAAVIVAGLPVTSDLAERSWDDEIELRTGCPTHQGVLRSAAHAIFTGIDAITAADLAPATPTVPVLAVHGSADEISPLDGALAVYRGLPNVTVAVIEDGRHDILNDVTHRSVAATVMLFLERLRLDPSLPVIVRDAAGR